MNSVSFAIAIPTYNRQTLLAELLNSIQNINIYVSDNGGYLDKSFQEKYSQVRFAPKIPEVPVLCNWNAAANLVKEKWFALPGDDDLYYPASFEVISRYLIQYPDIDVFIFGHHEIDGAGKILGTWQPKALQRFDAPNGFSIFQFGVDARMPSIIIKKELFDQLNGFDDSFKVTAGDSDFIQRALLMGNTLYVPEIIAGYRIWTGGSTHNTIASEAWMHEIDRWCNKMAIFCQEHSITLYNQTVRDEIYARNLIGGIVNIKKQGGYRMAWKYFLKFKYPARALFRTQLHLFYSLIKR
jgi:glycosyltransferase involved in cell wall biosynthesis